MAALTRRSPDRRFGVGSAFFCRLDYRQHSLFLRQKKGVALSVRQEFHLRIGLALVRLEPQRKARVIRNDFGASN